MAMKSFAWSWAIAALAALASAPETSQGGMMTWGTPGLVDVTRGMHVTTMQTIHLADGGILLYEDAFLPPDVADRFFTQVRDESAWERKPGVFGHMQPRLIATYGEPGLIYRYSGRDNVALPWTPTLLEIKRQIEAVEGEYNYCLLNRYRSGQDSMGMHADDEPEMGNVIGSLSLGATRTFRIRHNTTKETMKFQVGHGTLVIMAGTMQQFWKHEIPKTKEAVGERINLTFRLITRKEPRRTSFTGWRRHVQSSLAAVQESPR